MENEWYKLIELLANKLGTTSEFILIYYTQYFAIQSMTWMVVGWFIVIGSIFASNRANSLEVEFKKGISLTILIAGLFLGLLFIGSNVADFAAPKAAAIHQLLKDLSSMRR